MKKRTSFNIMLGLLLVMSLVLSACGTTKDPASSPTATGAANNPEATQAPAEKVTLRLSTVFTPDHPFGPAVAQVVDEFMKKHPEVTIEKEFLPAEARGQKLKVDLASDNLPEVFVTYNLNADSDGYVNNKKVLDLTESLNADPTWKDGFIAGALDNYKAKGIEGIYAAPIGAFATGFYYNKALFQQAGVEPPKTYSELLGVIKKLNAAGIAPWAIGNADTWRSEHLFTALFYKLNGIQSALDIGAREISYNSPAVVETFSKMAELANAGAFEKGYIALNYAAEVPNFNNGKAAMRYSGSWTVGETTGKDAPASIKDNVGFFPFPAMDGKDEYKDVWMGGTSDAYAISNNVRGHQKAMAIELVKALTSSDTAKLMTETGHDLTAVKSDVDPAKSGTLLAEVSKSMATGKAFAGDFVDAESNKAVKAKIYEITQAVLSKQLKPEDAAKQLEDAVAKNK